MSPGRVMRRRNSSPTGRRRTSKPSCAANASTIWRPLPDMPEAPEDLRLALVRLGLLDPNERPAFTPLTGGVSSDIWRVDLRSGPVCIKRALSRLKVAADWRAPVERNRYEAAWLRLAAEAVPGAVPALAGQDAETGSLVMAFLDPA